MKTILLQLGLVAMSVIQAIPVYTNSSYVRDHIHDAIQSNKTFYDTAARAYLETRLEKLVEKDSKVIHEFLEIKHLTHA